MSHYHQRPVLLKLAMKNVCRFCSNTLQAEHSLGNGKPHTRFTCDKCKIQFSLPIVSVQSSKSFEGLASCPFCNATLSKDKGKTTLRCNKCNIGLLSKDLINGNDGVVHVSQSSDETGDFEAVSDKRFSSSDVKVKVIQVNDSGESDIFDDGIRAVSNKKRVTSRSFALKSTRAPTNPKTFHENLLASAGTDTKDSDQNTVKSFALKSTRPPRNPQLFDENLEEHEGSSSEGALQNYNREREGREIKSFMGEPFGGCRTTENGRELLKLVKCANKSKTPEQMLQTFFDRISAEILDDLNLPSRKQETLPINQHQVIYEPGIENPLEEQSVDYLDITTKRPDQKRTHKLHSKYKRRNFMKMTKSKQKTLKIRKSNILVSQVVKSKFEIRDSAFEKRKDAGDQSSFHKCAVCDKSFAKVGNLNVHVLIHTEEKPYECPHCDRGFSHQSTLKGHILIHTGQKPYSCSRCMYSCRQVGTLNTHTRKKHCS